MHAILLLDDIASSLDCGLMIKKSQESRKDKLIKIRTGINISHRLKSNHKMST